MTVFEWKDRFSVNVDEMDKQHKRLLRYCIELQNELKSGATGQTLEDLLNNLIEYFNYHFAEEERLMKSMNYPELEMQHYLHAIFCTELEEVVRLFLRGDIPGRRVLALCSDWYINHMVFEDQKYGEMIKRGKPLA